MIKESKYVEHIDFLRAIAVILVILFHLDVSLISGGFLGVDVFFVISGYLITRNIKNELIYTNNFDFKKFYMRRIRRLIPSLLLMLFFTFILGFLFFPPSLFSGLVQSMFFSSFAVSNFYFLSEINYFDFTSNLKPLLHTWSLAVEEQFYLIYPLTLFLILKIFKKKKHIVLSVLFLLTLSLSFNLFSSKELISENFLNYFISGTNYSENLTSMQFFTLPFRIFEFLMGAILVFISKEKYKKLNSLYNLLGLLFIILSCLIFDSETPNMSSFNIIPCIGASLFIFNKPGEIISSIYNYPFFKLIGKLSYTLYLFHWPIIVFYGFVYGFETNFIEKTLIIVLTFVISYFIYNFYENPLRNNNIKTQIFSNQSIISFISLAIIIISNIKFSVMSNNGWIWRVDKKKTETILTTKNPVEYHKKNWGAEGYKHYGFLGSNKSNHKPNMIWMGDSHAGHYSYGLDSIMVKQHDKNIFMSYSISTLHFPDIIRKGVDSIVSKKHLNKLIKLINKNPGVPLVISHFWNGEMKNTQIRSLKTDGYEDFSIDSNGYKKVCEQIIKLSKLVSARDIIIIGETPYKDKHSLSYIDNLLIPKYLSFDTNISSTFQPNKATFSINTFFDSYFKNHSNIHFINPSEIFCEGINCLEHEKGNIFFSDKDHLSKKGSLKVIKFIENDLLNYIDKSSELREDYILKNDFPEYLNPNEVLNYKSEKLIFEGWYNPEKSHRWSEGDSAELKFRIKNKKKFKGEIELNMGVFKNQEVKFILNDSILSVENLKSFNKILKISFNPSLLKNADNNLKFEFSNPKSPGEKDRRILAFALRTIKIE